MNYVQKLTMHCKKWISTRFSKVANPLSDQLNSDFISNNLDVHSCFEVILAPNFNTGVLDACLIESFRLLSSRLPWC